MNTDRNARCAGTVFDRTIEGDRETIIRSREGDTMQEPKRENSVRFTRPLPSKGRALPAGYQWNGHDYNKTGAGAAARRRMRQIAKGQIDDRQLAESAKIAAPFLGKELPESEIRDIESRVRAQIDRECQRNAER